MSKLNTILLVLATTIWFGCSQTAPIVEEIPPPLPEPKPGFVTSPLPGIDSLVIQDVVNTFDSTFVDSASEIQAEEWFLEGQQLVIYAESILTAIAGPSILEDTSVTEDADAFAETVQLAREAVTGAARAQAAQDSVQAQSLLATAQERLENAVAFNPQHEESRYQLAQVYAIRANHFREQSEWEEALKLFRELSILRADEHGLWAEMAIAVGHLNRPSEEAVLWLRAADIILENTQLSFDEILLDSTQIFAYSIRAYQAFVKSKNGTGVHQALLQAHAHATSPDESRFAEQELIWAQWDHMNLEHRLVFDSLKQSSSESPLQVLNEFENLIPKLTRPAARHEANYTYAVLSYDNGFEDRALENLKTLWQTVEMDSTRAHISPDSDRLIQSPVPYPNFTEDLRQAYATLLFDRARYHRQGGSSGLSFTYLMQVIDLESIYTGKAYIEALRLARYNPQQALDLEPRVEAIFDELDREDQLGYLKEMGGLYRRIGELDKTRVLLERYNTIRN